MSENGDWENPSEELKRANLLAMDMGKRIAELEAEVERLKLHLRGCCGEGYESCEAIA